MDRRLVLVEFTWTRDKDPRVPLGHASLLAALRAEPSLDVRSVVVPVNAASPGQADAVDRVLAEALGAPQVDVAIGVYVWGEAEVQRLIADLRRRGFTGRIILGGPQISYATAGVADLYPGADVFIRGYAEDALRRVATASLPVAIPGVVVRGGPDLCEQATVNLEALPSPWLEGVIPLAGQRFIRWETQRGCPFRCRFCQHREAGARLKRRDLASGRIAREIDLFCATGVDDIAVLDPIFNSGDHAVAVLERFVERGFRGRLALQCRAEMVTPEFLDAAERLNVCLELGLQTIHPGEGKAVGRNNHIAKVDEVLGELRRRHIDHEVSIIFGLPEQTLASFGATVAWCLERRVPRIKAFPLLLLRGTELDRDRDRWGLVASDPTMAMVVRSATFTTAEWQEMARLSDALRASEDRHPTSLAALVAMSRDLEPELARWRPGSLSAAA